MGAQRGGYFYVVVLYHSNLYASVRKEENLRLQCSVLHPRLPLELTDLSEPRGYTLGTLSVLLNMQHFVFIICFLKNLIIYHRSASIFCKFGTPNKILHSLVFNNLLAPSACAENGFLLPYYKCFLGGHTYICPCVPFCICDKV